MLQACRGWDFPGGLVVKKLPGDAGEVGLIPGRGTEIPHAMRHSQKIYIKINKIKMSSFLSSRAYAQNI